MKIIVTSEGVLFNTPSTKFILANDLVMSLLSKTQEYIADGSVIKTNIAYDEFEIDEDRTTVSFVKEQITKYIKDRELIYMRHEDGFTNSKEYVIFDKDNNIDCYSMITGEYLEESDWY